MQIDTVAPTTTQSGADDVWHKTPVTVTFTGTDAVSGVELTKYSLDGGPWTSGHLLTVSGDGAHTLAYRSTDVAGNTETAKTCVVLTDTTPPRTTASVPTAWTHGSVTVTLSASDAGSGTSGGEANTPVLDRRRSDLDQWHKRDRDC